jgi:hypothetical protein
MNEDEFSEVLGRVVPEAPSPDAWAGAAVRRSRRRRRAGVAAIAALAVIAVPVGAMVFSKPPVTAVPAAPAGEVRGDVLLFGTAEEPELCLGAVRESYPPQCGGPSLKGDFDWAQVEFEEEGGVRWTNQTYTVRGFYDPTGPESGSFTLTAPVVVAPVETGTAYDLPELCDDPYAGGGSPDAAGTGVPEGDPTLAEESVMQDVSWVAGMLPVVNLWRAEGSGSLNVLVQGDADDAFQKLRAVWKGGLCVQPSDAPTEERRTQALMAVTDALPPRQFLSGDPGGGGVEPALNIKVILVTPEIEAAVRKAAQEVPFTLTAVFTPVTDMRPSGTPDGPSSVPATPERVVLTGTGAVQQRDGELPRLCLTVGYSDPIHCEGPTLKGDFDWEAVPHDEKNGVRTSTQEYTVTGEYDPADGEFGALLDHLMPEPAGIPGVELERYSTLCADPDAQWPDVRMGHPSRAGQDFDAVKRRACERLTGPVDDALLDGLAEGLQGVAAQRLLGLSRDGNDILLRVVHADDDLLAKVGDLVEETGMPVVVRTALTPIGAEDTTIVVPTR